MKVWVIAPDRPSGDAFDKVLRENGIETEVDYPEITPRVLGDRMNPDLQVANDLEKAIGAAKWPDVVIACNTLQLWLPNVKVPEGVKIYTTFEAARKKFPGEKPVWLGTTPTVKEIGDFPTLLSLGKPGLQDLTQEVIWRVKGMTGAEIGTAMSEVRNIKSEEALRTKVIELLDGLRNAGVKEVILGCTELPMAFEDYASGESRTGVNLIDPARLVAEWLGQSRGRGS